MWVRKPVVAGSFYPSNPKGIEKEIDGYLNDAEDQSLDGDIIGLISPHAGYVYSAPVAAYSFNQLKNSDAELAIVLAPSHRARFDGASVIPSGVYETPLGGVEIDKTIGEKLVQETHFNFIEEVHSAEHSLEVQIPFLQRVLGNFKLVPIVIGTIDLDKCMSIAEDIYANLKDEKRDLVVVISTDLSHYHSYKSANELDGIFVDSLKDFSEESLYDVLSRNKAEACGQGPVLTGLNLCKKLGASKVDILKYANSGDTAGGKDQVVGYLAAAILK